MRFITQKNRAILREMISSDFKVRYQGSALGYLWSLLRPLFIFAILYVVFTRVFDAGKDVEYFPVYLLLGIVLWNFFVEATNSAMTSVVARGDLIKKISIPRYLVVLSSNASALINLGLNLIIVFIMAIFVGVPLKLSWAILPIIIIELWVLSLAVGFNLSALFVKYRDVSYIWEVLMQAAFYLTPILYAMSFIPTVKYQQLILLNPMAQIIQDSRWVFISHKTVTSWQISPLWMALLPLISILVLAVVGFYYFRREAKFFAENI